MLLRHEVAPSYRLLRPFKPIQTAGFPVYKHLVDELVEASDIAAPNWPIAHVLGTCSGYAYSTQPTVAMMMARMGLEENFCAEIAEEVDAMFISSMAYLVQSKCGRAMILCYRGTGPGRLINWLADADVSPEKVAFALGEEGPFEVHAGFYRNVRATRYEILNAIQRALNGQPMVDGAPQPKHPLEALYITGHSLGGAMASLMGIMLCTEPAYAPVAAKLKGVYTFGQPMVGSPALARSCSAHPFLSKNLVRFIYARDVVPALPPTFSANFAHFGAEWQFMADRSGRGEWRHNQKPMRAISNPIELWLALASFVSRQVRYVRRIKFILSVYDHGPQHYISALALKNGVPSEFGDEQPGPPLPPPAQRPAAAAGATASA